MEIKYNRFCFGGIKNIFLSEVKTMANFLVIGTWNTKHEELEFI